ncbi:MAG: 2-phospho-L-lactate guanylyltransferase [Actinobacteria bacterium]|nr:2-phospho-L-lactate guanylyltransferase [Actinomycetota bacterium]
MDAAVLIPIKAFHEAKQRLEPRLGAADRERLARWTAERVVAAAGELPTYVVCDDRAVAAFATDHGATVLWEEGQGLNGAVTNAAASLRDLGYAHVVVVHGDLPRPEPLGSLVRPGSITLVPDLRLAGTNVLALPTAVGMTITYGAGSFRRHLAAAGMTGAAVWVVHDRFLALDIDFPSDLDHPLVKDVLPSWLPTNPGNPSPTATR